VNIPFAKSGYWDWRWAGICLTCLLFVLLGSAVAFSPVSGLVILGMMGILIIFFIMLIRPEMTVLFLLITLAFGIETLDLFKIMGDLPGKALIEQISSSGSVTVYDLLVGLGIFSLLVRYAVPSSRYSKSQTDLSIGRALASYLIVGCVATVIAGFTIYFARLEWSLLYLVRLLFTCLPYVIVVAARPSLEGLKRYAKLYVFLTLIPAIRLAWAVFQPESVYLSSFYRPETEGGFSAMGLGIYLGSVVGICITAIQQKTQEQILSPRLAWFFLLVSIATMVLSQKRAPLVGLVGILIVWVFLQRQLSLGKRWFLMSMLLTLIVAGTWIRGGVWDRLTLSGEALPPWLATSNQREFLPEPLKFLADYELDPNITGRIAQWYYALQAIATYPLGVGFRGMILSPYSYPHNIYLQIIAEFSFIGFVCFIWLIRSIFRMALKLCRGQDTLSCMLGSGVFFGFVGMLVQGMFEESFHNWDGMALLWLLTGMAVVLLSYRYEVDEVPLRQLPARKRLRKFSHPNSMRVI